MKRICVVTLSYNNYHHLFDTIKSVCKQDYPFLEYVISDDGCPSFPKEEVISFIENNKTKNMLKYKVLTRDKNMGTVRNSNEVYHNADCDYYINLSSGDVFFSNTTVSTIVAAVEQEQSNLLLTSRLNYSGNFIPESITPHVCRWEKIYNIRNRELQLEEFLRSRIFRMASGNVMCISKSIIEKLAYFNEEYFLLEDAPLFLKYLDAFTITLKPNIISIWSELGGVSTGNQVNRKLYDDLLKFENKIYNEYLDIMPDDVVKQLRYKLKYMNQPNKARVYLFYMKHLPMYLHQKRKSKCEKEFISQDMKYIEEVLSVKEIS